MSQHNTIFHTIPFSMPFIFEAAGLGNGTLVESFFILVTIILHVPGVIVFVMECHAHHNTYHTQRHTRFNKLGPKVLTFILGFRIVYKQVEHNTYQTMVKGVQHVHDSNEDLRINLSRCGNETYNSNYMRL